MKMHNGLPQICDDPLTGRYISTQRHKHTIAIFFVFFFFYFGECDFALPNQHMKFHRNFSSLRNGIFSSGTKIAYRFAVFYFQSIHKLDCYCDANPNVLISFLAVCFVHFGVFFLPCFYLSFFFVEISS